MDFRFKDQEQSGDGDAFPFLPVEILSMDSNSIQLFKKALHAGKEKVYNIRVMVVGQFGVGKTTLIKRLLGQPVNFSKRRMTEGIDVHKHCCKVSLDTGEWIQQVEDSDQLYILHRLNKVLSGLDQKPDISQEQDGIEIDEVQSSTQLSITNLDKETGIVAVPLDDAKSSESEKKDSMMNTLRLLNENADKLGKDVGKYAAVSVWDFAGQYALYTTHQMFLTSRAIYLLVIDLSQQITDLIQDDTFFFDADGILKVRHGLESFQIWMNSIHSIVKSPNDIIPVILVGTHVDKIPEKSRKEVIDKYFTELRYMLKQNPAIRHLIDDIAIDNTQPDPMLEELKKRIFELSSKQPHWGEERPARWLPLEQAIMTLKASGSKVVPLSLIEEINMSGSVKIKDRNELELFLEFHHEMGTILYFSVEELREKIVLDPQWMIDAVNSLITAKTFIETHSDILKEWCEFNETGKLTHELIDVIWSKENNPEFHYNKDHILRLMEQLNIIAIPRIYSEEGKETKVEDYFLAPCMLHQKAPLEIISPKPNSLIESSPVLCYVFTGYFLHSAIFHGLVAACIAHWPVAKKKKEHIEENLIFSGCCVFQLDKQHKLTLHFREHVIFLRVTRMGIKDKTPSSKLCVEVRRFITRNLLKIIGYLGKGLKFEYFIQCPEYNGFSINSLIPVSRLKENTEVHCEFHDHLIESCKVLDLWFKDQEQSGGSDAYPLIPFEILSMDSNSIQLYKKALHAGMEKVYNIRVMVVGQFGVGKTTLIKRLLGQPVDISERNSTEGIDVHKHCCKISLDKGEWIQQVEDSDELHTLNRLIKLLPVPEQKPDISQEQEDISEVIYHQREITSEIDATTSNVLSITSASDQEVQSSTQLSITRRDEVHHVEHLDKETNVDVPQSDAKSSESEKTKDTMIEILNLVNDKVDKLVKDVEKYAAVSIWDFAGQYAYYTTHQMFLTSRAIYLLVIDLSQPITDLIQDDKCSLDADGIKLRRVHDLFHIWMNSIHSIVKSPKDIVPVILVGTHVDKLLEKSRKEAIDEYFIDLRCMLREKPTIHHLKDDIAIDNTQPDHKLEELKKRIFEISSQQPHWGEEKPARWLPLEQAIMTLKASGTKVVPRSLIEELNMSGSVKIEDINELELFLKFHHEMGTILYFSVDELREEIVLNPEWMIDALKSLIRAETCIKKYPAITSKFYDFRKTGKLTHDLIDAIWTKETNPEFHNNKNLILRLMVQLNIIAIPRIFSEEGKETKEESFYLAPCMLQQETPEEIISPKPNCQIESSPVLCYVFTGNFLPSAIFHRLVAACVARWPIAKKMKEYKEENLIFSGCCVFQLEEEYKLTLLFKEHVIFLRVTRMGIKDKTPSSKQCIEVRKFITRNLKKIIGYLAKGLEFKYSIQCPEYNGVCINCLIPLSRLKEKEEVRCAFHDHMIESCKVLDFWFEDQIKNIDGQDKDDVDTPITQEHINHVRLCNALTTVCSNALREILLTNVPMPHPDIYKAILANKAKLKLNKDQFPLVFPDPKGLSTGKVEEFDISLLYTIIRNINSVPAPSNGWGKPPTDNPRDTTLGASVERIRTYRNHISGHSVDGKISQQEFEDYWVKIDEVLREIEIVIGNHGYLEDLEKRKNQAITPHEAHELQKTFQEYKKRTEAAASDIESTVEILVSKVKKLRGNQN